MEEDEFTASLSGNEMIQTGTYISKIGSNLNGKKIYDLIAENTLKDWKDGVDTGEISAIYSQLESPGRILRVNDKTLRLGGITQKKAGHPSLNFEFQEVK